MKMLNSFKWIIIAAILLGGVVANLHYAEIDVAYRAASGIVLGIIVVGIIYTTSQGRQVFSFAKQSRTEMRKVVWPTRQETVQTALVVVGMVVVTALILWGFDTLFMWLVGLITGQRG